jgi:hypothetical protein
MYMISLCSVFMSLCDGQLEICDKVIVISRVLTVIEPIDIGDEFSFMSDGTDSNIRRNLCYVIMFFCDWNP